MAAEFIRVGQRCHGVHPLYAAMSDWQDDSAGASLRREPPLLLSLPIHVPIR